MSKDTLELLRECDSGIKMAVGSIDEVSDTSKMRISKTCSKRARRSTASSAAR